MLIPVLAVAGLVICFIVFVGTQWGRDFTQRHNDAMMEPYRTHRRRNS